ncbi:MAG: two-component system sensor histidine kinase NtrB [bacterium]
METVKSFFMLLEFSLITDFAYAAEPDTIMLHSRVVLFWMSIIIALALLFSFVRKAFNKGASGKAKEQEGQDSKIEFMVSTFHELVQKLKEKERELGELKKKAEDRAEDMESYNENILQSVPSGVISFDPELRITHMNSAAEKILGIQAESCLHRFQHEIFHGDVSEVIRNIPFLERGEVLYETPLRKRVWLGLNISPLKNREGETLGKIIIFTDLTDLRAMESQIKLREHLSTLGEMSAGIAHELRNPMGVIAGYTKILLKQIPDNLKNTVTAIDKEIAMMNRIISDFMSFTHPLSIHKTRLDVFPLIQEITDAVIAQKNINVELHIADCRISADESLMRQVFSNLIQNAVDAMGDHGELVIQSERTDASVNLFIRDSGHGIAEELKDKIFLPFYTTKESGTGLGLAIVHKIITAHGGTITFDRLSDGTVFRMALPCE